jgi:hypothetical protein
MSELSEREMWQLGKAEIQRQVALESAAPDMLEALTQLHAFVGIMFGRGAEAAIPETVPTPLGPPVKLGAIMRDAAAAIAKAEGKQ